MLDALFSEEPTLRDKLEAHINKTEIAYKADHNLDRASKRVFKLFKKALADFSESNKGFNAYNVSGEGVERYALSQNVEAEIDDALNNKYRTDFVKLTENTPSILLSQKGVKNLPLFMKPSHIRENIFSEEEAFSKGYKTDDKTNYHGLGKEKFLEVIGDLDNVTEAYRGTKNANNSARREKYFLLISKIKDAENNIINVPIYINEYATYHRVIVDTNKVATVFGKNELQKYIKREIERGNIVRIKKGSLQVSDSAAPIAAQSNKKASSNSILQPSEKINPLGENSSKKFSEPKISVDDSRASVTSNRTPYTEYDKPITAQDVATLRTILRKSINEFTSEEIQKTQKWAHKFWDELGTKSPFFRAWFGDWRAHSTSPAELVSFAYGEQGKINYSKRTVKNRDMNRTIAIDDSVINDSLHYASVNGDKKQVLKLLSKIDEILEKGILLDTQISNKNKANKKGSTSFMHYLYTPISVNGAPFIAKLTVEEYDLTSKTRAYNLQRIEMSELSRAQYSQMITENRGKYAYNTDSLSIAQLFEFVKSYDKNFSFNPVNSLLLNADGTPKVFYHGTNKVFETFKPGQSGGIYLADNRRVSEAFTKTDNVMEVYPSLKNPLMVDALVTSEFFGITSYKQSFYYEIPTPDVMKQKGYTQPTMATEEISEFAQKNGYDGVIITNVRKIDGEATTDVIVFSPEQIKSAAPVGSQKANIGTFDSGMGNYRYSVTTPGGGAMGAPSFVDPARRSASGMIGWVSLSILIKPNAPLPNWARVH